MRHIYLFSLFCGLALLAACQDEDTLVPRSTDMSSVSRFEFPQGNDTWDLELQELAETFNTIPIYTDFDSLDLNQQWSGTFSITYRGDTLTDEHAEFYTNFLRNHIFAFLKPELCDGVMPNYIYLVDDLRRTLASFTGYLRVVGYFDGLDYWAFSLRSLGVAYLDLGYYQMTQGEIYDLPANPWEYKIRRTAILHNIVERIVEEGNVSVPSEFSSADFNYNLRPSSSASSDNYYLKLGYPGLMSSTNYNFSAQTNTMDARSNFTQYLKLGLRYTRDSVLAVYPEEQYPLIIKYYDITMDYMRDNYDWDISAAAEEI